MWGSAQTALFMPDNLDPLQQSFPFPNCHNGEQIKMRILCVEDDADSREMMNLLLKSAGHEVVFANGIADGLRRARQESLDLIILDNWVEGGSGVELCKAIRCFDAQIPIVFLSAAAYVSDIKNGLEAGAQVYLTKPTGLQKLVQTVENLCPSQNQLVNLVR
jgi:DNA-binding response OmpR family regulator